MSILYASNQAHNQRDTRATPVNPLLAPWAVREEDVVGATAHTLA